MNNGDKKSFGNFEVEAVPSYNIVRGPNRPTLPSQGKMGRLRLLLGDKRVYVSGDTECIPEMNRSKHRCRFRVDAIALHHAPPEAADCIKAFKPKIVYRIATRLQTWMNSPRH